jgi:hypothetical protein
MAAVRGGVVDQDNSTSKRQSHKITGREGYVSTVLWMGNSTSKSTPHPLKRQSHEITVREGYVSLVLWIGNVLTAIRILVQLSTDAY